ncbi:hypothetical protein SAMN02745728_01982 [Desulfovibrio litoralis DSM 11393]|uniref:Uncharacterized protein n=1 Tax=Desulfovibrio litoralis DSM 11393 TaxID=1121455 RepID=A0A1M7TGX5_9BACT|nr:hypothetical protein SAMN02745728_01982 [Desulfovibrio litoralis DSM 11393]
MQVRCISNSVNVLPVASRCNYETEKTDFSFLNVGLLHNVYGLQFLSCRVDYLICQPEQNPFFIPSYFFEVQNALLPPYWSMCTTYSDVDYRCLFDLFHINALIGYHELVTSYVHYTGVIERENDALCLFFKEKKRIDDWQQKKN